MLDRHRVGEFGDGSDHLDAKSPERLRYVISKQELILNDQNATVF
jgi:hypothetical protein